MKVKEMLMKEYVELGSSKEQVKLSFEELKIKIKSLYSQKT